MSTQSPQASGLPGGPAVLALPDTALADTLQDPGRTRRLGAALDGLDIGFAEVGGSRDQHLLRPDDPAWEPNATRLEATVAAAFLGAHTRTTRILVAASPHRDHPYNLARRLASLHHQTGGRVAWAALVEDATADGVWGDPDSGAWQPRRENGWIPQEQSDALLADAIQAIRELWASWPLDAVVADREAGVFVEESRIHPIDHAGVFGIRGPLNVPGGSEGTVVVLQGDPAAAPLSAALADVALTTASAPPEVQLLTAQTANDLLDEIAGLDLPRRDEASGPAAVRDWLGLPPLTLALPERSPFSSHPSQGFV